MEIKWSKLPVKDEDDKVLDGYFYLAGHRGNYLVKVGHVVARIHPDTPQELVEVYESGVFSDMWIPEIQLVEVLTCSTCEDVVMDTDDDPPNIVRVKTDIGREVALYDCKKCKQPARCLIEYK